MTLRNDSITVSVASGATASSEFAIAHARGVGIHSPEITSGTCLLLGATNSGGPFRPASAADGSGDLTWSIGAGSKYWWTEQLNGATVAKLELSAAQAEPRSFTIIARY